MGAAAVWAVSRERYLPGLHAGQLGGKTTQQNSALQKRIAAGKRSAVVSLTFGRRNDREGSRALRFIDLGADPPDLGQLHPSIVARAAGVAVGTVRFTAGNAGSGGLSTLPGAG